MSAEQHARVQSAVAEPSRAAPGAKPAVLMVARLTPPDYSGAGLQALRLSKHLQRRGRGLALLAMSPTLRWPRREWREGVPVIRWPAGRGSGRLARASVALALILHIAAHPRRYGVVHLHGNAYLLRALRPMKRACGFTVVHKATMDGVDDALSMIAAYGQRSADVVDRFICTTQALADRAAQAGVGAERIAVVPNGVDLAAFRPPSDAERRATRASLGILNDDRAWVTAGGVVRRKRLELLIEAWGLLAIEDGLLLIVGPHGVATNRGVVTPWDQGYLEELQGRVSDLGLTNRVRFLGARDDVSRILGACDGFVFSSRQEGSPNAIIEALAVGLPVVSTMVTAAQDLRLIGDEQIRFVPADPRAIADAVRARHGSGIEVPLGVRKLDMREIAARYDELYDDLDDQ